MRRLATAAALALASCGGGGGGDASFDWIPDTAGEGDPLDGDVPDVPTDPAVSGRGQYRFHLPSEAAPGDGLGMRISYPGPDGARHVEGAPVVVVAPGGESGGSLGMDEVHPLTDAAGVVVLLGVLPGAADEYGRGSSGEFDYRGPACKRALADMIRFALGLVADDEGFLITDRVPWADTSLVGVVGVSSGGNLALQTLADHASELAGVDWLATWESPVGDQYATVELGDHDALNPYYTPGSCTGTTCPWPGLDAALAWDGTFERVIVDPLDGTMWPLSGVLYLDEDGNGSRGSGEFLVTGIEGPGTITAGDHLPFLYHSVEVADVIEARESDLFPMGRPTWIASPAAIRDYWNERDGSLVVAEVHSAFPDMLVMVLGTAMDEVQGQPDHPHIRTHLALWIDAGHAWARLDPDAAYMAEASGGSATGIPETAAGDPLPWPGTESSLIPEELEPYALAAAVMELSDRVRAGNTEVDLDAVIF